MANEDGELKDLMTDDKEDPNVDIVEKSIGVLGRWHIAIYLAVMFGRVPGMWQQLSIIVIAPPINVTCVDNITDKCSTNCSDVIYDRSVFTETIQTQWNLICDKSQLPYLAQTITICGIMVGSFLFGMLSDKYGRRNPLIYGVILQLMSSGAIAFAPWFWLFVILRFTAAMAAGGVMITSFVLIMELIVATIVSFDSIFLFRDWHHIQLAITLPCLLLLSYYWIVPESPRWLLKGHFFDLFRRRNIRIRTICISVNWFVCGMCFYGGVQYIGQLGGNSFINITISALFQYQWNVWYGYIITTVYIYSAELFPTIIRNRGVAICSISARIGSMITPFIVGLAVIKPWLPSVNFVSHL
ncbi:hypothetical protein RI129_000197 [Pyrocoelia pectoralis]|uniref:Uncharacterized protein n=1 Tax=Pyrocoelia pectoralis TaxID=417401 RepID=A0AAN7ZFI1_9COLE